MRTLVFLSFLLISLHIEAQTLNLPVKVANARSGSQFVSMITSLSLAAREDSIFREITVLGNVPDFQRNLVPLTITKTISSVNYTLTVYVLPEYLSIGNDSDYFLCPMTPVLAQKIATATGCTMPTRKLVNDIWNAATVKLAPSTIPPSSAMTTVPVFDQHNATIWGQRSAVLSSNPLGELLGGTKKDVVISTLIATAPAPLRVVIYGWHQLNGSPIQPLSSVHDNQYADYSHGIRLLQNDCILNGNVTTLTGLMASSTLNSIVSDEGVISSPYYPVSGTTVPVPGVPANFSVRQNTGSSLLIDLTAVTNATQYEYALSSDGVNFSGGVSFSTTSETVSGLTANEIYFIKLRAGNSTGWSSWSEVLGAATNSTANSFLVVNAFDRASAGNTYDFIRQHGKAIFQNQYGFSSCTNEAVISGAILLSDYNAVDYILGEESTANETFSAAEQTLVAGYLDNGGKLFVSGSEIAWDLDFKGTTNDKAFINNYLMAQYIEDSPNSAVSVFYDVNANGNTQGPLFDSIRFDNGTYGTYNVDYPDVIAALNNAWPVLHYNNVSGKGAGIAFDGYFPNASTAGKLVYLAFPFETIVGDSSLKSTMHSVLDFFFPVITSVSNKENEISIRLINPVEEKLELTVVSAGEIAAVLHIINLSGQIVGIEELQINSGINKFHYSVQKFPAGLYTFSIQSKSFRKSGKFVIE